MFLTILSWITSAFSGFAASRVFNWITTTTGKWVISFFVAGGLLIGGYWYISNNIKKSLKQEQYIEQLETSIKSVEKDLSLLKAQNELLTRINNENVATISELSDKLDENIKSLEGKEGNAVSSDVLKEAIKILNKN